MAIFASIYAGPPRHYGSTRTDKRYIAIHNTANDATAEGEASYARRREDTVSSHYYVDNDSLLQSLDTDLRAYHAGSTIGNSQAIAYEITGTNGKSRTWWLANVAWTLLARQIAADCREHAIEPRLLTVAEIKAGSKTGIITHDQMRQAWGGTTHTDPGANFPLDHLLALVRAELGDDDMTPDELLKTPVNSPSLGGVKPFADWLKGGEAARQEAVKVGLKADALSAKLDQLSVPAPAPVDPEQLKAAVKAGLMDPEFLAAVGKAAVDAYRAEMND
jgi:hypothetical protein